MDLAQLDATLRIGAVTTILLIAWRLLRRRRRIGLPAVLFAPLAVCLSGFVMGNTPLPGLRPTGLPGTLAHMASGYTVIFLWWFCLACFDARLKLRGAVLSVGLSWAAIASFDRGLFGGAVADKGLSYLLVALGFGIVGHLVWALLAGRSGDLVQRRRDLRIMVAILLGGMLFIDLAADAIFGLAWRPLAFAMIQNGMILGFGLWLAEKLLTVRPDVWNAAIAVGDPPQAEPQAIPGAGRDNSLNRRLAALMEEQRLFLDPDLTFATIVARMGAPERTVRRLINHELGHDHFRSFVNRYRVAEARRLLADPRRTDDKLIAIALDSGFASLASFNRVFRAAQGCTPGQYRAAARPGGAAGAYPADIEAVAGF